MTMVAVDGEICRYDELVAQVRRTPGPVRIVGIDGCGGAGKTTFAERLSRAAGGCPVIHTDDFASHDEPLEWWPRLLDQVIEPLTRGIPASYRPYDWVTRRRGDAITILPAPLVVVEGVGATRAAWRDRLALRVWVETPRALRLRRGLARDGEELREFWHWWMSAEDAYVAAELPDQHADLVVDGAAILPHDADTTFVVRR